MKLQESCERWKPKKEREQFIAYHGSHGPVQMTLGAVQVRNRPVKEQEVAANLAVL